MQHTAIGAHINHGRTTLVAGFKGGIAITFSEITGGEIKSLRRPYIGGYRGKNISQHRLAIAEDTPIALGNFLAAGTAQIVQPGTAQTVKWLL